ncbi:MAG: glycosyltransferase family 4 protein [Chloroflexi bacterium]|nr:glycosyltransferase family 4 protein [Chloroflexota bacterium]
MATVREAEVTIRPPDESPLGHAVHVTTVHAADDPRIFNKEALALRRAGWKVTLIARADHDHTADGIRILRLTASRKRFHRMTIGVLRAAKLALRQRADVIHLHDPELIPVGVMLRLVGATVVYDAHEDLPAQIAGKAWIARPLAPVVAGISAILLRLAGIALNAIVAATGTVAKRYPARKAVVIHNYPDFPAFSPITDDYAGRPANIVYVGGLSEDRGLRHMIGSVALLPPELGARLHLAGRFQPESLEITTRQLPWADHVQWHGWLPADEVVDLLRTARVGLCVLQPLPNYVDSLPTKLFEYMAAGLPVVASDFAPWREIVEEAGCGLLVDPTDVESLAGAIASLLADPARARAMGEAGRLAVMDRYGWPAEADRLVALYARLSQA